MVDQNVPLLVVAQLDLWLVSVGAGTVLGVIVVAPVLAVSM